MAPVIKHAFTSAKVDAPDPSLVRPSNWNDEHVLTGSGWFIPGMVIDYAGNNNPDGFLECYGQSVPAATYPDLFAALVKSSTVTITVGAPGVINWTGHGLRQYSKIRFRSSGTLPTGIVANTDYYVSALGLTANTFRITDTFGGSDKALTGTPSGTITATSHSFGVANDLSTFSLPDLRGRVVAGYELMGGVPAHRLIGGSVEGRSMGGAGGDQTHTLIASEVAPHNHLCQPPAPNVTITNITISSSGAHTHGIGSHTHSFSGVTNIENDIHDHQFSTSNGSGNNSSTVARGNNNSTQVRATGNQSNWHRHAFSGTTNASSGNTASGGAHTHSASGTATATIANFNTNTNAGGGAHNNVQPTLVMRKLIYAGV